MTIGRLKEELSLSKETVNIGTIDFNVLINPSATIYEIIGYIKDAKITAMVGEFIVVDIVVNADDVNEFNPNDLPLFDP